VTEQDVVVVGAGPTGLACGIELKQRGVKALLIDKGCVVNSLYNYPTNLVFFTTPELLEIGGIPMTSMGEKPNRTEALKYYRRVTDYFDLSVRQYELVERITGDDGSFQVHTKDRFGCPRVEECDGSIALALRRAHGGREHVVDLFVRLGPERRYGLGEC
jgi:thioredoxin reductase (NADPH)